MRRASIVRGIGRGTLTHRRLQQLDQRPRQRGYHAIRHTYVHNMVVAKIKVYHWDFPQVLEDRYGGW